MRFWLLYKLHVRQPCRSGSMQLGVLINGSTHHMFPLFSMHYKIHLASWFTSKQSCNGFAEDLCFSNKLWQSKTATVAIRSIEAYSPLACKTSFPQSRKRWVRHQWLFIIQLFFLKEWCDMVLWWQEERLGQSMVMFGLAFAHNLIQQGW